MAKLGTEPTRNSPNASFVAAYLLKIDHVYLRVSNLKKSIDFYQAILGFKVLEKT